MNTRSRKRRTWVSAPHYSVQESILDARRYSHGNTTGGNDHPSIPSLRSLLNSTFPRLIIRPSLRTLRRVPHMSPIGRLEVGSRLSRSRFGKVECFGRCWSRTGRPQFNLFLLDRLSSAHPCQMYTLRLLQLVCNVDSRLITFRVLGQSLFISGTRKGQ
jgi:hypothetical protein